MIDPLNFRIHPRRTHAGFIPLGIPEDWFEHWIAASRNCPTGSVPGTPAWNTQRLRSRWYRFNEVYGLMAEAAD